MPLVLCLGRKREGTLTPQLVIIPPSWGWGDIYSHYTRCILPIALILPQEEGREFSVGGTWDKNYALQTSTLPHLFLFGVCLHSLSVTEADSILSPVVMYTVYAWQDGLSESKVWN